MVQKTIKTSVDDIVSQFWRNGYLTISRKYGKYLPEPTPIGQYEVDAVAKYKKKLAVGITVGENDLNDPGFLSKLMFLASRQTRYSKNDVKLFVGVPSELMGDVKKLVAGLSEKARKNIKLIAIQKEDKSQRLL